MKKRPSKKPKAKVLVPFSYCVTGQDSDGEYFELNGRVKATCERVVKDCIDWMVEYDYNNGQIDTCLISALDGACTMDTSGITILFEEGPLPSFLEESEDGEADIPWVADKEKSEEPKDFLADAPWATSDTVATSAANAFSKAIRAGGKQA